jgi:Bacterial protein of unknown function (DUF885)
MSVESAKLQQLGEEYIRRTCADFPQWGSGMGFAGLESKLSGSCERVRRERNLFLEGMLTRTESLYPAALKADDWLDRRCFLSLLRTELLNNRDLERWRTNPQECCDSAVGAVFELVIRYPGNMEKARPLLEARLAAIPRYLKDGAAAIRLPVPLWTELAIRSCKGASAFLLSVGETLSRCSGDPARTLRLAGKAARAFETYAKTVARKKQADPSGFSMGRERFEFLVRERTGLDLSLPEIEAEGWRLIEELNSEIGKEARRITGKTSRKSASQLLNSARDSWVPGAPLLELYARSSEEWRRRVVKSRLYPLPPGETLEVMPVPDFMREHFPTAAYTSPGPFEKRQRGIFWVNDLGAVKKDPEEALRESRQHFGLELTSAHEGYPGHHLQFAIQNRHPSRIRRLCSHAIFYEGWTMWCEKLAVEKKWVSGPHARLQQLHDALWRAYRIVIDCGLHSGKLSHEEAALILVKGVGFTPDRARADVNWYTSQPTVPMSYLLGRLELERVKDRLVRGQGWSLRKFHHWALSHGAVPWAWIERAAAL